MKFRFLPIALAAVLLLSGCNNNEGNGNLGGPGGSNNNGNNISGDGSNGTPVDTDFSQTAEDMFSNRDSETSYDSSAIEIQLTGSSATCSSNKVQIDGGKITITDEGTYIVSGTLDDGMIIVNAEESDKLQIVFNSANITSATSAPLYILEGDKVFVTLAEGSTNTLANGGTFTAIDENNIDGVVYSKQDLTFNGNGALTITAPVEHGIVCKDDLVFTGGTYTITSASHGMDANDSVRISAGTFTIDAGKDAIHVENSDDSEKGFVYINGGTFNLEAEGDGIDAGYYVQIENGNFTLLCGGGYENGSQSSSDNWGNMGGGQGGFPGGGGRPGGRSSGTSENSSETSDIANLGTSTGTAGTSASTTDDASTSMKGIKANSSILINGGTFNINSADDSIHSNLSVYINNGTFEIASGDDGIHGEEDLTITGGAINIAQSYEGLEALNIKVSGGNIKMQSNDDGINAAGGTDSSGTGGRDQMFGGGQPGMGGGPGGGMSTGNGSIVISGGSIWMYAKGDGLDANGTLEISGGYIIVTGPTQGDTAILDYDKTATITGGTFIGVGSTMMAQSFSDGTQGTIAVRATANGGTNINIKDSNNAELVSFTPETNYACIIISTPDLVKGETYTLTVGSQSGEFAAQ